ncbi:MAG: hypothetical protein S4CHLAM37_14250 [Chlamydiia bacterium]|nr:hypothetical protein [Chlamydiia bacterium]
MSVTDSMSMENFDATGASSTLYTNAGTSPEAVTDSSSSITDLSREILSSCASRITSPELAETAEKADGKKEVLQRVKTERDCRRNVLALIDAPRAPIDRDPAQNRSFSALVDPSCISKEQTDRKADLFMIDESIETAERAHKAVAPLLFPQKVGARTPEFTYHFAKETLTRPSSAPAVLEEGGSLGSGANSSVKEVTALGRVFAKKKPLAHRAISYDDEFSLTQKFDHPNVISCHLATADEMLLEHAPGGDLAGEIENADLTSETLTGYLAGTALGLAHMHEKGYIHRDVKAGNVLIGTNGALVADLETAAPVVNFPVKDLKGTVIYLPKEYITQRVDVDNPDCVKAIDSFTFGMMIYQFLKNDEMVSPYVNEGHPLGKYEAGFPAMYAVMSHPGLTAAIIAPQLDAAKRARLDPTGKLYDIMIACLSSNPTARPQMTDIAARLATQEVLDDGGDDHAAAGDPA